MATPTRPSGSWYSRSATASQDLAPFTWLASMPEMKMLIWVALAAAAPGIAFPIKALISGVSRGSVQCTAAPDFFTPQVSSATWATPAPSTPQEAAMAAARALWVGSTAISMPTFSSVGARA